MPRDDPVTMATLPERCASVILYARVPSQLGQKCGVGREVSMCETHSDLVAGHALHVGAAGGRSVAVLERGRQVGTNKHEYSQAANERLEVSIAASI
jgi:hypothetical protein